jgi:hypothetical protein
MSTNYRFGVRNLVGSSQYAYLKAAARNLFVIVNQVERMHNNVCSSIAGGNFFWQPIARHCHVVSIICGSWFPFFCSGMAAPYILHILECCLAVFF